MDLDALEQGVILRIDALPVIDLDPETGLACLAELDTPTGLVIVATQSCDTVRELAIEPYVQVAPIVDVDQAVWARSRAGRLSPRYFALPQNLEGVAAPVVDIRLIATVDKRLVLENTLPFVSELAPELRGPFAIWLGRRFARYAFSDELETDLLNPLRKRLGDRYEVPGPEGALVRSVEGVFVAQMDRTVKVLFLVEPGTKTTSQLDSDEKVRAAAKQLLKPIYLRARDTGWTLSTPVQEPSELGAFDLLYEYNQLELDLPAELEAYGEAARELTR